MDVAPRGIRNNNPGNIRHSPGVPWQGQSLVQTDDAFVQFDTAAYGLRAIVRVMRSYEREGIATLQAAVDRWAPPNENNSAAYVAAVCSGCSIGATDVISLDTIMRPLIAAIVQHENGQQPYTMDEINQGIALA